MFTSLLNGMRRHPLLLGFSLMFVLTWSIDLALAAQSRGNLPFHVPEMLGIFVGYTTMVIMPKAP